MPDGIDLADARRARAAAAVATTSIYMSGIAINDVIGCVVAKPAPTMSASVGFEL